MSIKIVETPRSTQRTIDERLVTEALIIDVDGYEGPLDVLLSLAQSQKVDLLKISVLQLSRQYLRFVEAAKELRIELAADYLVMAAWLTYLKSRLLLPASPEDEGPSGEELAAQLAFQLQRLEAMRKAAADLMARDQLGRDFFARGGPVLIEQMKTVEYEATLFDLMQAYARIKTKDEFRPYVMDRDRVFTLEQALDRMRQFLGFAGDWTDLQTYLPDDWCEDPKMRRSAMAAHFAAALELAKIGKISLRQRDAFGHIELKTRSNEDG